MNIFNPQVDRDRRRRDRGGRAAAGARARGHAGARARAGQGRRARRGRALRARGGDDRRGAARARHVAGRRAHRVDAARSKLRALARRPRGAVGLVVCPTPIGNLEDITLRVLAALRDADVVACEDTRHTRVLLERYGVSRDAGHLPRAQRARAGGGAGRADARRATVVALVQRRRACRSCQRSRASRSSRAASPRGSPSRCCPARPRAITALVASALPVRRLALRGLPPAQARRAAGGVRRAGDASSRSSRPRRVGASLAVLAELDPERPVAVCRELTKLHEEIVRGSASELAAKLRVRGSARARSCSSIGGAPERDGPRPGGGRGGAHAGRGRRPREDRGEGRRRAHRRAGQRALPGGGDVRVLVVGGGAIGGITAA